MIKINKYCGEKKEPAKKKTKSKCPYISNVYVIST